MSNLGEILKAQQAAREENKLASQRAEKELDRRRLEREEQSIRDWFGDVQIKIRWCAENERPLKNFKLPDTQAFRNPTYSSLSYFSGHPHVGVFEKELVWFGENGLDYKFEYCHDGVGISSWWELKVTPK